MVSGLITLWQIDGGKVKAVEKEIFFFFFFFFRIPVEQKSFLYAKN